MQKSYEWVWWSAGAVLLVLILWWLFAHRAATGPGSVTTTPPVTIADPSNLPGLLTTQVPWPANQVELATRLSADSLTKGSMEGLVIHIHQHLDLFINGEPITVPALIGINVSPLYYSPIHVHDTTGILHVESPFIATYTLGEFFDVWGVKFTATSIGGYSTDSTHTLRVYVNGQLYQGDPRQITLTRHEEIAIVYGTAAQTPSTIPGSFNFPAGY